MIQVGRLNKSYGEQLILNKLTFTVNRGDFFGILGPNGSGKSTLLKLLSGVEKFESGHIELDGSPLGTYSRRKLSRKLAVLQQEALPPVNFTVREVVEMGRFPYQNWLGVEKAEQGHLVDEILEKLGLIQLQDRSLLHLSGGERQRVALGKVMAQQPELLLLDEPTTYLDIGYQIQMMDHIKAWQNEANITIIAVLHELNLASIYCNRLLLLHQGELLRLGAPIDILQTELIAQVYGTKPIIVDHPVHALPQLILQQGGSNIE